MKLEDQVCSLDLSKKLRELGVKQESAFYWAHYVGYLDNKDLTILVSAKQRWGQDIQDYFAAFTCSELGEMLPEQTSIHKFDGKWVCDRSDMNELFEADTEADARGKMLCWLIEQGIVKP